MHHHFRLHNNDCSHESPEVILAVDYSSVSLRGLVKTALHGSKGIWGSLHDSEKVLSLVLQCRGVTNFGWNPAEGRCLDICWLDFGWGSLELS